MNEAMNETMNGSMPLSLTLTSCLLAISVFWFSFVGLRKRLFSEGYSILWFTLSLLILIAPFVGPHLVGISRFLGFQSFSSLLFLVGILVSFVFLMILSIHVSKLRREVRKLSQRLALNSAHEGEIHS